MATPKNRSVLKAFALLQAFRGPDEYLTSAELSRRAGLPEASGYRLIQTLEAVGAVVRDPRGRYRAGFILAGGGKRGSIGDMVADAAHGVLDELAERFGATAHAGILENGMVTYVAKAQAPTSVPVPTQAGAQQEAYCSAIGKVLLAGLTAPELEGFLREGELVPLTDRTITDPNVFRHEIRRVRESGYALDTGEAHTHLACVAVPVRNAGGETVAALSVVDRAETMDDGRRAAIRNILLQAADAVARRLQTASATQPFARRLSGWSPRLMLGMAETLGMAGGLPAMVS